MSEVKRRDGPNLFFVGNQVTENATPSCLIKKVEETRRSNFIKYSSIYFKIQVFNLENEETITFFMNINQNHYIQFIVVAQLVKTITN